MRRKLFITSILIFSIIMLHAQSWQWGRNGGGSAGSGSGDNTIIDMKHDKEGNMYILALVARFTARFMGDTIPINGSDDFLIYKLDCNGNKLWKKQIGDMTAMDKIYRPVLVLDNNENVYVCGYTNPASTHGFRIDTDTTFVPSISSDNYYKSYIVKFDKNGNYRLFKTNNTGSVFRIASIYHAYLASDNYLYALMRLKGNVFGITDTISDRFYIFKYDTNAVLQSMHVISDSGIFYDNSQCITSDGKGNVYVSGYTASSFPASYISVNGHYVSPTKSFICRFDTSGTFKWLKMNDDSAQASFMDIECYKNTIAITGTGGYLNNRPMSYDGLNLSNSYSGGINSTFVLIVDTNGHVISGSMFGVDGRSIGYSLDIDNVGNVCVGGLIAGNAAQIGSKSYTSTNSIDGFITKISPQMNYISSDMLVGTSSNQVDRVAFDDMGNVYAGGNFDVNMQLGIMDRLNKSGGGTSDLFIAKYGVPACLCPYAVSNYTDAYTSSLIYTYTSSALNADTIWWDFGDDNTQSGGTTAHHTYATAGNYTVCQHVSNDCSVDEFCKNISVVTDITEIKDTKESYSAIIYPNPASSTVHIHIQVGDLPVDCKYILFDVVGNQVLTGKITGKDTAITLPSSITDGVYLLQINNEKGIMLLSKRIEIKH